MKNINKNRIKTLNPEKQNPPYRIETQNAENRNSTDNSTTKQMLTQEDKINTVLIKKIFIIPQKPRLEKS